MKRDPSDYHCPIEVALDLFSGKYKSMILWYLNENEDKVLRYSELAALIPYASPKMLAQQLRSLEQDELIERVVYQEVPPRVEYRPTPLCETLFPALQLLHAWGTDYLDSHGIVIDEY